jgi:polyhydroxybutyrate depolymerase
MTMRFALICPAVLLSLLAAVRPAVSACVESPTPSGTIELRQGAAIRTFVVRVPTKNDAGRPTPVVFVFHPGGMNVQYMQGLVPIPRLWPEAVVVYPQALPRLPQDMRPGWQNRPGELDDRDLVFFDAMLEWLGAHACIDDRNVFVMGYSNGAQLSSVIACERSGKIAGAAIASGSLPCALPEPRPVIMSHGTRDSIISYQRAIESSSAWATRNSCSAPPKHSSPGCFMADSCATAPVVLCTYEGGHEYYDAFTRAAVDFFRAALRR